MTKQKVTNQGLKRLIEAEPVVKMYNGCFNIVSCTAEFSNYKLVLSVEVTNKHLAWQCGNRNDIALTYWKNSSGTNLDLPDVLGDKITR